MKNITSNIPLGRAYWLFTKPLPGATGTGDLPEGAEIVGTFANLALVLCADGTYAAGTRGALLEVDQEEVRAGLGVPKPEALKVVARAAQKAHQLLQSRFSRVAQPAT